MSDTQDAKEKKLEIILEDLQTDMGLKNKQEVVEAIIKLAYQRANIVCPKCGHHSNCEVCMSPEKIADEIMTTLDNP